VVWKRIGNRSSCDPLLEPTSLFKCGTESNLFRRLRTIQGRFWFREYAGVVMDGVFVRFLRVEAGSPSPSMSLNGPQWASCEAPPRAGGSAARRLC
jgi:hypothetical protein